MDYLHVLQLINYSQTRMSEQYYGKCFASLQEIKHELNQVSKRIRHRSEHNVTSNMKVPWIYSLFCELNQISGFKNSVKESYSSFLEVFLNANPSQVTESYLNGMSYIDTPTIRIFYMLESYFLVKLNVYKINTLNKHSKSLTTICKQLKKNPKIIKSISFPWEPCKKQKCFFMSVLYKSSVETFSSMYKNELHITVPTKDTQFIHLIQPQFVNRFYHFFMPLTGFPSDKIVTSHKLNMNLEEIRTCNISTNLSNIYIPDLMNQERNLSLSNHVVILEPICCLKSYKDLSINKLFKVKGICQSENSSAKTVVIIVTSLPDNTYIILKPSYPDIESLYDIGSKCSLREIKQFPNLGIQRESTTKSEFTQFTKCPCEAFNQFDAAQNFVFDFMECKQYPLKFSKKSLPILLDTIDIMSVSDFKQRIELASKLSHSFFDIESLTIQTFNSKATPGIYVKHQELVNIITGYHKIIMIGYSDLLDDKIISWVTENSSISRLKELLDSSDFSTQFHLDSNAQSGCITEPTFSNQTKLVEDFLAFVYQRAVSIANLKKNLLKPIKNYLIQLKELEDNFIMGISDAQISLDSNHKTEINKILKALDIFETEILLWGFNSSKYDNVILMPYIKYLLTTDHSSLFYYRNINIFRKGRTISNLTIAKDNVKIRCRDFLNIENPYTSLEDMAKKYSIPHSKAVFPHKISESISKLKTTYRIPKDNKYWTLMTGELISQEKRSLAEVAFQNAKVNNMYEYMSYYLTLDVLCLKECFFAYQKMLLETEDWDIASNKALTISSLMYEKNYKQQFSNRADILPVFEIKNQFIKAVLDKSTMGGITVCMFSGHVSDSKMKINSHLIYDDIKNIGPTWPGLYELKNNYKNQHKNTPIIKNPQPANFVHSYDMLSLYASAMYHDIPVGPCRQWHFGHKNNNIFINKCPISNPKINKQLNKFHSSRVSTESQECKFVFEYLSNFDYSQYNIIKISSEFHIGGKMCFEYKCYPDLFITCRNKKSNVLTYFIINFDGAYFHGFHKSFCPLEKFNSEDTALERELKSQEKHTRRKNFFKQFLGLRPYNETVSIIYETYTSCDAGYCVKKDLDIFHNNKIFFPIQQKQLSHEELVSCILQKHIRGFLVVKNLAICKSDRNPSFGFAIQKTKVKKDWLSPHTMKSISEYASKLNIDPSKVLDDLCSRMKILNLHKFEDTVVLHSDYFLFLYNNFLMEKNFVIGHVLEFCHNSLLKDKVNSYIERRFIIKDKIKELEMSNPQSSDLSYLKAVSSVLKLYNNSLYGFTLLKPDNYKTTRYIISHRLDYINRERVTRARLLKKVSKKTYLVSVETKNNVLTTQAHIGSTIMFRSKITFLQAIKFILENADPQLLELLYCDTDSIHFATVHKTLLENMLPHRKHKFNNEKTNYFFVDSKIKNCGVLDLETLGTRHKYITEKMYQKESSNETITVCKGVNRFFKKKYLETENEKNIFNMVSGQTFQVTTTNILSDIEDNVLNKDSSRMFALGLIPTKRFFSNSGHSITFDSM